MPINYVKPTGERPIEFWKINRSGEINLILNLPLEWDDQDIEEELGSWASQYFHTSNFTRYGWNEEKDFGSRE